jgi:hypothetical protein
LDDLIVGAYGANPNGINSGKAYIIFGKTDTNIGVFKLNGFYYFCHISRVKST